MAGRLPDPNRRRTNAPTIPTTRLPLAGRPGPVPRVPSWCRLGVAGKAWWSWAWRLPQACAWSVGDGPLVARRAALEDALAAFGAVAELDVKELTVDELRVVVAAAVAANGSRLAIQREMRELDDRLGLTPKALAALRWVIVADVVENEESADATVPSLAERRARISAS